MKVLEISSTKQPSFQSSTQLSVAYNPEQLMKDLTRYHKFWVTCIFLCAGIWSAPASDIPASWHLGLQSSMITMTPHLVWSTGMLLTCLCPASTMQGFILESGYCPSVKWEFKIINCYFYTINLITRKTTNFLERACCQNLWPGINLCFNFHSRAHMYPPQELLRTGD